MTSGQIVLHTSGDPTEATLVLVHGLTEAGTTWPDAVRRWEKVWRVVAPDQRGHGSSPRFRRDELPRAMDVLVDDLLGVLALVGPSIVVGHSLGG